MTEFTHVIEAIDTHTAGEPARIVVSGFPPLTGDSMIEKKRYMQEHLDHLRTLLVLEPRGHLDMFGVVLTTPTRADADFGVLFLDSAGYLDMCGHSIIGTTTALIETGAVTPQAPETVITFDTPAGPVVARAWVEGGRVLEVSLANVAAFVHTTDLRVEVPGCGLIAVDVAYGGNFFALVRAADLGVAVARTQIDRLLAAGIAVRRAVNAVLRVRHPELPHINEVRLTAIYERPDPGRPFARSAVVFGEGQLDRSPCGTGTSALMALLHVRGELPLGVEFVNESVIGTRFKGRLARESRVGDIVAVDPIITGTAYVIGLQQFVVDPADPLKYGFTLASG